MRIKHKVNVKVASDTDMKNLLFAPDDVLSEVTIDAYARVASGLISIAQATNEDLPLGDVTAVKGVYFKVDQDVTIKLNGGTDIIQLRKASAGSTVYARFFIEADITQINITAPADADVTGVFCVWGDAA